MQSTSPTEMKELQNKWWLTKAAQLQTLGDSNEPKRFYQSIKAVRGTNHPEKLLHLDNKTIISEKQELLATLKDVLPTLHIKA